MLGSQLMKGYTIVAAGLLVAGCRQGADAPVGPAPSRVEALSPARGLDGGANAVTMWNANAGEAALAACIAPTDNPLHESRLYAVMHLAVHDALNAIDLRSRPYAFAAEILGPASPEAAVAAAARDVLVTLIGQIPAPFPAACVEAGIASVEADYLAALDEIPSGVARTEGLRVGRAAAAALLALRAGDGSDTPLVDSDYPQGTAPGEYRFTPGFTFVFAPGWADVTPFALRSSSQFRPKPPYALTSRRYATELNEIKALGGDDITTPSARTDEQTEMALFWVESSPLQWNRIARTVAEERGLDMWESARLFALLDMALADGYVASFDTKRHYNFWRPVTAIRMADTDGNRDTDADPTWTPLVPTPPITDYESAHAVEGGAGAQVLRRVFGTNGVHFSTCSLTLPSGSRCGDESPVLRSYHSFSQAAEENAFSRVLVGFHFRTSTEEGLARGRKIGNYVAEHFLRPVRDR